jgi:spore coat-associated protein N
METMIKKVVGLSLAGLLVLCLTAVSAWAYYTDTETSSNNQITAGTLDLKTNNVNGVTQTLYGVSLKPGTTVGPQTISLYNAGSLTGSTLNISCSYTESDAASQNGTTNMTADQTAAVIQISTLKYDGDDLTSSSFTPHISDVNANGYIDVYDLLHSPLTGLSGLNPYSTKDLVIGLTLRDGIDNNFQGDGISITFTFVLNQ